MTNTPAIDTTPAAEPMIGKAAAGPAPAPAARHPDSFEAARAAAVAHHVRTLRHALQALRGLGQHDLAADLLAGELEDTVTEARSIAARKAGNANRRPGPRLAPTRSTRADEVN